MKRNNSTFFVTKETLLLNWYQLFLFGKNVEFFIIACRIKNDSQLKHSVDDVFRASSVINYTKETESVLYPPIREQNLTDMSYDAKVLAQNAGTYFSLTERWRRGALLKVFRAFRKNQKNWTKCRPCISSINTF